MSVTQKKIGRKRVDIKLISGYNNNKGKLVQKKGELTLSAGLFSASFLTFSTVRALPLLLPEGRVVVGLGSCLMEIAFVLEILDGSTS